MNAFDIPGISADDAITMNAHVADLSAKLSAAEKRAESAEANFKQLAEDDFEKLKAAEARVARLEGALRKLREQWTHKHVVNTPLDHAVVECIIALGATP